jgi:hypothetical protein
MKDFVIALASGEIKWLESKSSAATSGEKGRAARLPRAPPFSPPRAVPRDLPRWKGEEWITQGILMLNPIAICLQIGTRDVHRCVPGRNVARKA